VRSRAQKLEATLVHNYVAMMSFENLY
jgi:hypothetical protein